MPVETSQYLKKNAEEIVLSILILTYNHERFIEQCLMSIQSIDIYRYHIWILDDGSTDGTLAVAKNFADKSSKVTIIEQKNSGGYTSRNLQRLLEQSHGKYVMFMSGDDMLGPDFPVTLMIDYLEKNKEIKFILPEARILENNSQKIIGYVYKDDLLDLLNLGNPKLLYNEFLNKKVSSIFIQGMIINRTLLDRIGGFDVDLSADDYALICKLCIFMSMNGFKFQYFNRAYWIYRIHDTNIHRNAVRQIKSITEVVGRYIEKKYWKSFEWHIIPLNSAYDFNVVEDILIKNLDKEQYTILMKKIIIKTYAKWIAMGNFSEIKNSFEINMNYIGEYQKYYFVFLAIPLSFAYFILKFQNVSDFFRGAFRR